MVIEFLIRLSILVLGVKVSINLYRLISTTRLMRLYENWVTGIDKTERIFEKKQQVVALWQEAGLEGGRIPILEPVGYGALKHQNIDIFLNFPQKYNDDFVVATIRLFQAARGVYKKRLLDGLNPIEWIIFLVKMPEIVLKSAGVKPDKRVTTLLNFLWWLFASIVGVLQNIYSEQLKLWFEQFISH